MQSYVIVVVNGCPVISLRLFEVNCNPLMNSLRLIRHSCGCYGAIVHCRLSINELMSIELLLYAFTLLIV